MARGFNRRFRRPFGGSKGKLKPHWVAGVVNSTAIAPGGIAEFPGIVAADYSSNTSLSPSGVTMLRTIWSFHGFLSVSHGAGRQSGMCGIVHIDDDEAPVAAGAFDPNLGAQLSTERWLWFSPWFAGINTTQLATNWDPPWACGGQLGVTHVDIKQRVRLRDSGISLIVKNDASSGDNINLRIQSRTLIIGDTT